MAGHHPVHTLERKANKRFKILEDYDLRKRTMEEHAVQLVLLEKAVDPNLPMIPAVTSAVFRKNCGWCYTPFWGNNAQGLCDRCQKEQDDLVVLNKELGEMRREVSHAQTTAQLSLLRKLKKDGATPEEILEAIGPPEESPW